ncbi:SPOR domain-containing protein [Desulfovibrio ferrophilus]|uniref:Putative Sporulation domain-containing protein n=1 Tax=Desulfovibrio ferrophilus TaxID=241368 RepID=A0A2Z6AVQ6_9BACT|nr:SPOR domain-containing protein [Desulfovibrio ferrophilus]BBD07298.1 putative Sporulation domain-containing protein [Desulfovibrio ferrophilus]
MPREAKNRERKEQKEPKRFSFSLSSAGMVSLTVVSAAALAWVFILGVLVGRGYKPEQAVPQLADIMPRVEQQTQEPEAVLKAEELDFFETLKKKPGATTKAPPASKPRPKVATAEQTAQAKEPTTKPEPQEQSTGQQFRYVYQVGSLKNPDMATAFVAKLNKAGLKTSIEQAQAAGAIWHRVLVHYTGTPESTEALKATLSTMGVVKPIMKSKLPL